MYKKVKRQKKWHPVQSTGCHCDKIVSRHATYGVRPKDYGEL